MEGFLLSFHRAVHQKSIDQIGSTLSSILRVVVHDWERPYYKEGVKSLGYLLEKEVERHLKKAKNILITPKNKDYLLQDINNFF